MHEIALNHTSNSKLNSDHFTIFAKILIHQIEMLVMYRCVKRVSYSYLLICWETQILENPSCKSATFVRQEGGIIFYRPQHDIAAYHSQKLQSSKTNPSQVRMQLSWITQKRTGLADKIPDSDEQSQILCRDLIPNDVKQICNSVKKAV